jgi:DNA-binding CsgD family transcriptional regulator
MTKRELEVLQLVADGLLNKQIARKLWVSEETVKFHLDGIFTKLDVRNRAHAVAVAIRRGLIA